MKPAEGRCRVVIEAVEPQVDCGRYPARRILGDEVTVTAAVFGDGHDLLSARLLYRHTSERRWKMAAMKPLGNDLWTASFAVNKLGSWKFTVQGWVDHFATWNHDLKKRLAAQPDSEQLASGQLEAQQLEAGQLEAGQLEAGQLEAGQLEAGQLEAGQLEAGQLEAGATDASAAGQDIPLALRTGAALLEHLAKGAKGTDARQMTEAVASLRWMADQNAAYYEYPLREELVVLAGCYPDLRFATKYMAELPIWVDRGRARYSTWYEMFPRSASPIPGQHGTLEDVEAQVPEIAAMGFDVLYLPPIHPIGTAFRKGPNNATMAGPGDNGSPWAIGAARTKDNEGGHKALHPELGTMAEFDRLVETAKEHGMELALDIAFQCSPDHPWVKDHPHWFNIRPDGTIQYAENPPKKYQDIYPLNFESVEWRSLWDELYSVFEFWIKHGVKIFRVDNPHTKALPFWEWCLGTLREKYPDTIYLAEAFTRPHVMYSLAKAGFTQSYTYFTWRVTKPELQTYLEEITRPPVNEFFEPNFWPNTPDILHKSLQEGGRAAFMQRLILAATLTANYGIYGPAYELGENTPAKPAAGKTESEEYFDSEKYEIRQRNRNQPHSLVPLITRLNKIRAENGALQRNHTLYFHPVDNSYLMCYSKSDLSGENTILVAINLDPKQEQGGWIDLDLKQLGIPYNENFDVEDLLTGVHYTWRDRSNYVALRPDVQPAHVFRVTRAGRA